MFKKKYKVLAPMPKKDGSSWWMNCGDMYEGKEPGSFNLFLNAVPAAAKDGKLMFHLRELTEEDFREQRERSERSRSSSSGAGSYSGSSSGSNSGSGTGSGGYSARGTLGQELPLQFGKPSPAGTDAHEPVPF